MATNSRTMNRKIASLVRQYSDEYGRQACLSSVVRAWLRVNKASSRFIGENIQRVTECAPANDLEAGIISVNENFSLKEVEVAFENLIHIGRKRTEGTVYTPNYVIDYILRQCIGIRSNRNAPYLIDPACGSGGFLVRAIPVLSEKYRISKEAVMNEFLYGIDINGDAIECTKLSLELFCAESSINPPSEFSFLLQQDTLLTTREKVLNTFGIDCEGFEIVVTNPPYVKLQNIDDRYRTALRDTYPQFTTGSFSLAMLFLIAGYRFLSDSGVLGYITQNNIYTSLAGKGVREFLQRHQSIHTIVDFGHKKVFPESSAYTCLMFLDKGVKETLRFYRCTEPEKQLDTLKPADFHHIEISGLKKDKWRLAPTHHLRNIQQIETTGTPLGKLAEIHVGFATLKDSVFLINEGPTNSKAVSNLSRVNTAFDHRIEPGITKSAIKIADFSDEDELAWNQVRVIQPYRKIGGKWLPIEESELRQEYPNAYAHLELHQDALLKRDKGKKVPRRFYEWGRTQGMEAPGPKLLTKTFNRGPQFLLDETDSLFCNGYSVTPQGSGNTFFAPINIKVLQKILNSWVMDYYARITSFQIEGDYQCFQKNFIERFGVPDISPHAADSLLALDGETLQEYICELFAISVDDVLEVVPRRCAR